MNGRSDNCIKNYYYSTLRKHIRRINKGLKQCQVAKKLALRCKSLTADILFPLVKEGKLNYAQVRATDPKKFEDLEHTMRMIFNHEDGQLVTQRGIIAAAQQRLRVEEKLKAMEDGQPGDVYDDDEEEEAEPPVREAPTKRSKPVQAATASEPAKKRQKTEMKKPNPEVVKIDDTESEDSPAKRTTPVPKVDRKHE